MIINVPSFLYGFLIAQGQGVSDAEARRLGLVAAVVPRRVLGLVLVSAIAKNEAASGAAGIPSRAAPVLAATPSSTEIDLSWTPTTGAATYTVRRAKSSGAEKVLPRGQGQGLTVTSYTDSDVTTGTTYFYKVDALDANDNRITTSNEVSSATG